VTRATAIRALGATAMAAVLAACGADGFGSGSAAYPEESADPAGSARAALHQPACWKDGADATIAVGASGDFGAQSSDGGYGHGACSHRLVVEGTGIDGKSVAVFAGSTAIPNAGKEWCEGYWSENEAQGCRGTPCTWTPLGAWSERARFRTEADGSRGRCERVISGAPPELAGDHGFSKIRVVTQSGWVYWYRPAYTRISVL
jgi:hypothetical protein